LKTSVYLPDDLAEQVRAFRIPMSEVVQAALRQAVADAEAMELAKAKIGPEIEPAVVRLRGILAEEERARDAERAEGRDVGIIWARDYATPMELRVFTSSLPPPFVSGSHSLCRLRVDQPELSARLGHSRTSIQIDVQGRPWWKGFQQGAAMVWEAVQPILEREKQP
jgi:hypothetical protein